MSWFFTSGCQSRSFSFSISPSKEYSGLISFRTDCLISMLSKQLSRVFSWHNNSKASILCYSAFFMVQLSHLYMSTGKTIPLTRWIFVSKVTSLLLICCLFVTVFLPRSKCLLISWLQSPSSVILKPRKIKSAIVSNFSTSFAMKR